MRYEDKQMISILTSIINIQQLQRYNIHTSILSLPDW